jgi:hypothetical protein
VQKDGLDTFKKSIDLIGNGRHNLSAYGTGAVPDATALQSKGTDPSH